MKTHNSENMNYYFGKCEACINENVHFCKYDNDMDAIIFFKETIMNIDQDDKSKSFKVCTMDWIFHDESDFVKVIDQLNNGAACGPDG